MSDLSQQILSPNMNICNQEMAKYIISFWKGFTGQENKVKETLITVKLLNNIHHFCRGLVAVVNECPLIRGCEKMSTNPHVWNLERSRSFNLYKVGPSIF